MVEVLTSLQIQMQIIYLSPMPTFDRTSHFLLFISIYKIPSSFNWVLTFLLLLLLLLSGIETEQ